MTRRSTTATLDLWRTLSLRKAASPPASTAASVTYGFGELDALVPAYAANLDKSQGSEYPAVVISGYDAALRHVAAATCSIPASRCGKRLVVLVGQKKAIAIAVRNVSGRRRWSKLAEWLRPTVTQKITVTG